MGEDTIKINALLLGRQIQNAREALHLPRSYVAAFCGISDTSYRHIETGDRLPSLPTFVGICNALRTSPSYLLCNEINLKVGVPDAYTRIIDILLRLNPREAERIVMTIDALNSTIDES